MLLGRVGQTCKPIWALLPALLDGSLITNVKRLLSIVILIAASELELDLSPARNHDVKGGQGTYTQILQDSTRPSRRQIHMGL